MEGTIGEIRIFAAPFAPRNWWYCDGTSISVRTNQALFAILGKTYGGDGVSTFQLPDLRGRVALGAGQGPGLSSYSLGQQTGTENEALLVAQMPAHNHAATAQSGNGTATGTLYGVNGPGGQADPGGHFIGEDNGVGATPYASAGNAVAMNGGSIAVSDVTVTLPSVTVEASGGNAPHPNMQPSLALSYIICMTGWFPPRN